MNLADGRDDGLKTVANPYEALPGLERVGQGTSQSEPGFQPPEGGFVRISSGL